MQALIRLYAAVVHPAPVVAPPAAAAAATLSLPSMELWLLAVIESQTGPADLTARAYAAMFLNGVTSRRGERTLAECMASVCSEVQSGPVLRAFITALSRCRRSPLEVRALL